MKTAHIVAWLSLGALLSGCAQKSLQKTTSLMATEEYAAREPIATSLFPSDQAVLSDEAVARILSSKLELPAKAKVALMRFPNRDRFGSRYYGTYYWRDLDYLKVQQEQVDTLSNALLASERIAEIMPLPLLMIPSRLSIPVLREAAVRMQADLLLVYQIGSDSYSQHRMLAKDKVKAYCTCELVVLDVRTGLVPFTRVVSRERLELKESSDLSLSETLRRAEQAASTEVLGAAAADMVTYLKSVPRKGE